MYPNNYQKRNCKKNRNRMHMDNRKLESHASNIYKHNRTIKISNIHAIVTFKTITIQCV